MSQRLQVGVIGATGMVGQRFISLLADHPWFKVTLVAASATSAGKSYEEAVAKRWVMEQPIPSSIASLLVKDASNIKEIASEVGLVFCAVDMPKAEVLKLEEDYAKAEVIVVSNNSAARSLPDVPMLVPEINPEHLAVIEAQKKRLGSKRGFIVVKPNCSLQSYVPAIHPLLSYQPVKVAACTYQAISGAGKTFTTWPEMTDNVIPFIKGEEEKSEQEPLKLWGSLEGGTIKNAALPQITSQCIRVPVSDGHLAAVFVSFVNKPTQEEIIHRWTEWQPLPQRLGLPSAPSPFLTYFTDDDRPQTKLDRNLKNGMGVAVGRLRADNIFDYKFVCLSHNTIRGAAGGAILMAELLKAQGYLE